jgi:hypothetical protein
LGGISGEFRLGQALRKLGVSFAIVLRNAGAAGLAILPIPRPDSRTCDSSSSIRKWICIQLRLDMGEWIRCFDPGCWIQAEGKEKKREVHTPFVRFMQFKCNKFINFPNTNFAESLQKVPCLHQPWCNAAQVTAST